MDEQRADLFVLDSNVYIEALRDPSFGDVLRSWEERALAQLWLSSVVAHEVLSGARADPEASAYGRRLVDPFRRRRRILVPDLEAWGLVASARRRVRATRRHAEKLDQAGFLCDLLIAASCRRVGATLITANVADFAIIRGVLAFRFLHDLPAL